MNKINTYSNVYVSLGDKKIGMVKSLTINQHEKKLITILNNNEISIDDYNLIKELRKDVQN